MQDVGGSLVGDMVFTMGVYRLELMLTNAESFLMIHEQYSRKSRLGERPA